MYSFIGNFLVWGYEVFQKHWWFSGMKKEIVYLCGIGTQSLVQIKSMKRKKLTFNYRRKLLFRVKIKSSLWLWNVTKPNQRTILNKFSNNKNLFMQRSLLDLLYPNMISIYSWHKRVHKYLPALIFYIYTIDCILRKIWLKI